MLDESMVDFRFYLDVSSSNTYYLLTDDFFMYHAWPFERYEMMAIPDDVLYNISVKPYCPTIKYGLTL